MDREVITAGVDLRLLRFSEEDELASAYQWYQDEETVWLVDGVRQPYSMETLTNMYYYLHQHGELYWIQVLDRTGEWLSIGDVTFSQEDLPIVIGDAVYRGKRVGQRILQCLIQRARERGWNELQVREIYHWNTASQKLFESVGFQQTQETEKGYSYRLQL